MAMDSDHATNEEREALLGTALPREPYRRKSTRERPLIFVLLCVLIVFCIDFGSNLTLAPQTRIYESIACRNYYEKHEPDRSQLWKGEDIPEEECKIKPVQSELVFVQGLQASFEALPSILLSVPYGRLADSARYGRKLTLVLAVIGALLSQYWVMLACWFSGVIPFRAVWFGSTFLIIGGGSGMATAILTTMISDVVEPKLRSTAFFQTTLSIVVAQFAAPLVSSWMMLKGSPWIPLFLGVLIASLGTPLLLILPETVHLRKTKKLQPSTLQNQDASDDDDDAEESPQPPPDKHSRHHLNHLLQRLHRGFISIVPNRTTALILCAFFVTSISSKQLGILLNYISTRYGIPLSKANFALAIFAGVNIFLLLVFLPAVSRYLTVNRRYPSTSKDLILVRYSITMFTVGAFCMAVAPTLGTMIAALVIYTMGTGFNALNLSLVSTFVEPKHIARLYSVISAISMLGVFAGSPLLAALFTLGADIGKGWVGLPFFGTTVLYGVVWIAVWTIRIPEKTDGDPAIEDGEDTVHEVETPSRSSPLRYTDD
ncbi:hypothetical protein AJ79_08033 [Helicocarpus griseus UAMH5409]|uniref:Major facilitator superfamily (MFS) profile domain-containing protein n=1 Tax=Helicocarpus griseus UAMH5409 TaxID=1447875 RepID=A0A2B7WNV8_9EURO|nr:hypothetical protein AJ79_08033 [Helicocarpus griseus UAMH5409]